MNKYKKAKILKIKSAISAFLINTQKIVKSVEPSAEIIIPKTPQKRLRSPQNKPADVKPPIVIPDFHKIKKSDISDGESDDNTDDEFYEAIHNHQEKIEILLRTCPELSKIKSGCRSTFGIHQDGKTVHNTMKNLKALEGKLGNKSEIYLGEAIKKIKWPIKKMGKDLEVNFS